MNLFRLLTALFETLYILAKLMLYVLGSTLLATAITVSCAAQERVYFTDSKLQADAHIYWSCSQPDARILVTSNSTGSSNKFSWIIQDRIYSANYLLWTTPYKYSADLIACPVDKPYKTKILNERRYKRIFEAN